MNRLYEAALSGDKFDFSRMVLFRCAVLAIVACSLYRDDCSLDICTHQIVTLWRRNCTIDTMQYLFGVFRILIIKARCSQSPFRLFRGGSSSPND